MNNNTLLEAIDKTLKGEVLEEGLSNGMDHKAFQKKINELSKLLVDAVNAFAILKGSLEADLKKTFGVKTPLQFKVNYIINPANIDFRWSASVKDPILGDRGADIKAWTEKVKAFNAKHSKSVAKWGKYSKVEYSGVGLDVTIDKEF